MNGIFDQDYLALSNASWQIPKKILHTIFAAVSLPRRLQDGTSRSVHVPAVPISKRTVAHS